MQVTYNMSFTTTYYAVSILADWLIDCVTPSISPICSVSFFGIAIYILPCVFPFWLECYLLHTCILLMHVYVYMYAVVGVDPIN